MKNLDEELYRSGARSFVDQQALTDHPANEILIAHAAGDLQGVFRENIQNHLSSCRSCARTFLEIASFFEERSDEDDMEEDLVPPWEDFQARLSQNSIPMAPTEKPEKGQGVLFKSPFVYGLAAALCFITTLALWSTRNVSSKDLPVVNIPVADIVPLEDVQRNAGIQAVPPHMLKSGWNTLILSPALVTKEFVYTLELYYKGDQVWQSTELQPSAFGNFSLGINDHFLAFSGDYELKLFASNAEGKNLIGTYLIRRPE